MTGKSRYGVAVLLLNVCGVAVAQDGVLDLIPSDAAAAVAIRNLNQLKTKSAKFIQDAGMNLPMRPSQLFEEGYKFLGVQGAVDENGSAAIILVSPKTIGKNRGLQLEDLGRLLVAVVPFKDRDKIAAKLGFAKNELKPGKVTGIKMKKNAFFVFVYARRNHLLFGTDAKVVEHVAARSQPLRKALAAGQKKRFASSDLVVHLGQEVWREFQNNFAREMRRNLMKVKDKEEVIKVERFLQAIEQVRFASGAVRLDGGFSLSVTTVFDKKASAVVKNFLGLLRGDGKAAALNGLPAGNIVLAQAARGDGAATSFMARFLFDEFLKGLLQTNQIITAPERPLFVGVFNEVWRHLQGNRAALYLNTDQQKHGLMSLVAVLETKDAKAFLKEMKTLARIGEGSGLKLDPVTKKKTVDIAKLIRALGSPRYVIRERAALKLRLIGEAALPYLEKASKKGVLETVVRAQNLHDEISQRVSQRRKDLLSKNPFRRVRPTFALIPAAEKRGGYQVDVLRIQIAKNDDKVQGTLTQLLGPDWKNMRLVVHGKRIVVLLGSDAGLLEKTLTNLEKNKSGLAKGESFTRFYKTGADARRFELHVSVARLLRLIDPAIPLPLAGAKTGVSSVALAVENDRLQLDVWIPSAELRVIARKTGLNR